MSGRASEVEKLPLRWDLTAVIHRDPEARERRRRLLIYPGMRDDEQRRAYEAWVAGGKVSKPCRCASCRVPATRGDSA